MENIIYKKSIDSNDENITHLEISIIETNEVEPYKEIRELNIDIISNDPDNYICTLLSLDEIDSIIEYLTKAKNYIEKFNNNSKPVIKSKS